MKPDIEQLISAPILLEPDNFTDHMWGGDWIPRFKNIASKPGATIGESWEFSVRTERPTRVKLPSGSVMSLREIISADPARILGESVVKRFGPSAPVLLKFIDAHDDLSLQVHPTDAQAKENETDSGKSEAWLVLETSGVKGEGFIYIGFNPVKASDYSSPGEFEEAFFNALNQANSHGPSTVAEVRERSARVVLPFLNKVPVKAGEIYEIRPGTLHALGRGVRLFEIQQSSDLTYRVWDWNRPDAKKLKDGKLEFRPLHVDKAKAVLDFKAVPPDVYRPRPKPVKITGEGMVSEETLVQDAEGKFAASRVKFQGKNSRATIRTNGSFLVLTVIEGSVNVGFPVERGRSVFVPAGLGVVDVRCVSPIAQIIKSYVPA